MSTQKRETPRTVVSLVDREPDAPFHKAHEVWVNGEKVAVKQDSVGLQFDRHGTTEVTLTLLPTEVFFTHVDIPAATEGGESS